MDFSFLASNRFWALVAASLAYAADNGFTQEAIIHAVYILVAGFIGIKTVDRLGDKAAKVP